MRTRQAFAVAFRSGFRACGDGYLRGVEAPAAPCPPALADMGRRGIWPLAAPADCGLWEREDNGSRGARTLGVVGLAILGRISDGSKYGFGLPWFFTIPSHARAHIPWCLWKARAPPLESATR